MTEEEYEAELAAQEAQIVSNVKEVEEDILSPQEVEAMKAKIANYAPWMSVDPEARARTLTRTPTLIVRAAWRREPRPPAARPAASAECHLLLHPRYRTAPLPPAAQAIARAKKAREDRKNAAPTQVDGMQLDPQAAELNAAGGLKSKVLSEDEIELRWETSDEQSRPVQTDGHTRRGQPPSRPPARLARPPQECLGWPWCVCREPSWTPVGRDPCQAKQRAKRRGHGAAVRGNHGRLGGSASASASASAAASPFQSRPRPHVWHSFHAGLATLASSCSGGRAARPTSRTW